MNGQATYNSNSFNTFNAGTRTGILTQDIDHVSIPEKVTPIYPLADTNGNVPSKATYPSKRVTLTIAIAGSSQDDLDSRIDAFKAFFIVDRGNLDINYNGSTRRYSAVLDGLPVLRSQKGLYATFTVSFICQPFGSDTTATSLFSASNHTTGVYNTNPTVYGNAPIQLPIFTITIDALTGTGDFVQISNELNSQTTLIYGMGLQAGDVLVFDSVNRVVTLNDTEIDFYGTFIELTPGANSLTYLDGFTTRTVDIAGEYFKQYQ